MKSAYDSPFAGRPVVDADGRRVGEHRWLTEPDDYEYEGVVADVYDLWFPPGEVFEDTDFFYRRLREANGPALDVGCGSGRLLIPFAEVGLDVEGLDASQAMLDRCAERAKERGLELRLHCQLMQELSLERRYACIYIPFSSFQLVLDREHALEALRRFHAHLEPGGTLLITNYVPWQDLHAAHDWRLRRVAVRPSDGASVLMHEATACDRHQQIVTDWVRYEVYQRGKLIETHLRTLRLRWYHPYELELLVQRAGFGAVRTYGDYTDDPVHDGHATFVLEARK
jgi:SAM-dependent methyltransferase